MEKDLTVTLDESLIEHAKKHAEAAGLTPDQLIAKFIEAMDTGAVFGVSVAAFASTEIGKHSSIVHEIPSSPRAHPVIGLLRESDVDYSENYRELIADYLAERNS